MEQREKKVLVIGVIGADVHAVGNKILYHAFTEAGFEVVNLGVMVSQEEYIAAAIEADADAIVIPERGPKPRLTYTLDSCENADVVFATRELASFCDPQSLSGARSMTVCPKIVYFTLATKDDP